MSTLDGERLSLEEIVAIAGGAPAELGPGGRERAATAHRLALRVASERLVYGRTTGVGANKDAAIEPGEGRAHAERLLRSHATSAGAVRDPRRVRATMAIRLNQLAAGGSGARPEVLDALAMLLAEGSTPSVREHGGVGTGDLGALATIALALPGVAWTAGDALPFLSSSAATLADAALGVAGLSELAEAAVAVAAVTFAAVDGQPEAFDQAVEAITPYDGARRVCRSMRAMAAPEASPAVPPSPSPSRVASIAGARRGPARLQDPFALRCLPQVHGLALDRLQAAAAVVEDGSCAAAENPVVSVATGRFVHHGGFHAAYLTSALDSALLAVAAAAGQSTRRLAMLLDPGLTGLPAFLGDGTPGASGAMGLEYAAGSALGDLRALAVPAALQTLSVSRGVEDDASYASLAARQALDARSAYAVVVACELVAAVRAVGLRGLDLPPTGWGAVVTAVRRSAAPPPDRPDLSDRDLSDRDLIPRYRVRRRPAPPPLPTCQPLRAPEHPPGLTTPRPRAASAPPGPRAPTRADNPPGPAQRQPLRAPEHPPGLTTPRPRAASAPPGPRAPTRADNSEGATPRVG